MFTINKVGLLTSHIYAMKVGDIMGIRGPLGNWYPWDVMEGKNVVIIGGGFAFTTLRSSIIYILDPDNRSKFKDIHVIYGARTPGMLLYRDELAQWETRNDINMHITVDSTDDPDWKYHIGFVPTITDQQAPPGNEETYAIICGPPIMIKFTQPVLDKLGYVHGNIIMSLEMRMKCGIGICGRCNIGKEYVCKDGPVFTLAQLNNMPKEY
jgi:sulfhydrogenase subunit gamma (sulfur reductase)